LPVERGEGALAGGREGQVQVARVVAGAVGADQLRVFEAAQQAAQIAGVEAEAEAEVAGEFAGRRALAVRQLPEQARLGEGEPCRCQTLVQDADAPGIDCLKQRLGCPGQ